MLFRSNDTATTEIYTGIHTLSLHDALPIYLVRVGSKEEAIAQRFFGSPTVQINGVDIEGLKAVTNESDLCCRLYNVQGALRGQPSKEMIQTALSSERNEI